MRKIKEMKQFSRDIKRETKGVYGKTLKSLLKPVLELLANDLPLTAKYRDHQLNNNWKNRRECHIKPDLLLIYHRPDDETLRLERLGSHAELDL